jgi:hypothetical protein
MRMLLGLFEAGLFPGRLNILRPLDGSDLTRLHLPHLDVLQTV